jgi:phosphoesterase RecJ-like protein
MEKIITKIKAYDTIIIHRHTRPDGDCMGSQIGLKDIITNTFPDKLVYAVGEESLEFSYLGKMDHIKDDVYNNALVLVLDVANFERISDIRYRKGKEIIRIDHHPKIETLSEYDWVDTSYSSCCEMIVEMYLKNDFKLSDAGAKALFYGIVTDTNRFVNPDVSKRTFYYVTKLLAFNLDLNEIFHQIYDEDLNITRLKGYVALNFTCTKNGLAYIKIDKKLCDKYLVTSSISNVLVNTLANIKLAKAWFVAIYDKHTGKVRISLRSKGIPINHIAEKYGGGGHKHASGVIVNNFEIVAKLIIDLDKYLED